MKPYALFVSKEKTVNTKSIAIDTIATTNTNQPSAWQRTAFVLVAALALMSLHLLFPSFAFAQEDPFSAIDSGLSTAADSAMRYVFYAGAIGFAGFGIVFAGQIFWPNFYNQHRDFVRNAIWVFLVVMIVVPWFISMAKGS
jgi:hypothetical protein